MGESIGTELYHRAIEWSRTNLDDKGHKLTLKCWQPHPWMVNAFTGPCGERRDLEMREWCAEQFGDEAWPIHGKTGDWYRGGATVFGWTHFGFATKDMMDRFNERWPAPPEPNQ